MLDIPLSKKNIVRKIKPLKREEEVKFFILISFLYSIK
jgi:hypothetical protein